MFDLEFWGEPISVYTDEDAQDDGILVGVSELNVWFNGKLINRATTGATLAADLRNEDTAAAKDNLQFISVNSVFDGEGEDAWGIFKAHPNSGNRKLWLIPNEVKGYTIMLPEDY